MDKTLRSLLIGLALLTFLAFVLGLLVGRIARKPTKTTSTEASIREASEIVRPPQLRSINHSSTIVAYADSYGNSA
jgi:hypothetical protein